MEIKWIDLELSAQIKQQIELQKFYNELLWKMNTENYPKKN